MKTQSHPGRTHHQVKLYRIPRVRLALLEMSQNPQNVGGGGKQSTTSPQQVHRIMHCPQELQKTDQNVKHQRIPVYIIKSIK